MDPTWTGAKIRQSFIDFFNKRGHTFVRSSSLVPGGDQTLLFTNAGMVQFKDVFLGTDHRPYTRAVNSQKCMRVAGKHNDLDDVGRDDTHHTFFEMLGNWSFGDYYKKEAISWAWELLTEEWGLDKSKLWTTCFKDEKGEIPADEEAAKYWYSQPGINPEHVTFFGRKENFWEMAETGPCGPCSEIHIDLGPDYCDKRGFSGHTCRVNGDCKRFVELWNLVFIQYNRTGPNELEPLPATHVDTGMGLERVVSVLQGVYSNYRTDLLMPLIETVRILTGQTEKERDAEFTPYRVIADHCRAATFLIADGVVPGNTGRNYVCRMIIRRAARFGGKLGLHEPFLEKVAEAVIEQYGAAYPELIRNKPAILESLTREEDRFKRTLETGLIYLEDMMSEMKNESQMVIEGEKAFDLYATHGLPLEITRDIARENGMDVDETGFRQAMEDHRMASGAGKAFGPMGGEDVDIYRAIIEDLIQTGKMTGSGISYSPYNSEPFEGQVLAIVKNGESVKNASTGDLVEIILPRTNFYIESGGQVSDSGLLERKDPNGWLIAVEEMKKPAAGVIVHIGHVVSGKPQVGDLATASVDLRRRQNIMRNHTATHLLHAELHKVLGQHARQAGSLVAPDRLRFDFTHPESLTTEQLEKIESGVNDEILNDHKLSIVTKPLALAIEEGATALFGEKYGENVRTITIGDQTEAYSYELCGGTHVDRTADIGLFLIISEGSTAAGIRRIEAVTGHAAYDLVKRRFRELKKVAGLINSPIDEISAKLEITLKDLEQSDKEISRMRQELAGFEFSSYLEDVPHIKGIAVLSAILSNADTETLRRMTDLFKQKYTNGVVVVGSNQGGKPSIVAAVTDDLIKSGLHAGDLVKVIAQVVGGNGGGRPNLAQAGGKDPERLAEAMDQVIPWVKSKLI